MSRVRVPERSLIFFFQFTKSFQPPMAYPLK
jgi:hypothetical protein